MQQNKICQLNQLKNVLDAFENIFVKKEKKNENFHDGNILTIDILNILIFYLIKCVLLKKKRVLCRKK